MYDYIRAWPVRLMQDLMGDRRSGPNEHIFSGSSLCADSIGPLLSNGQYVDFWVG